MHTPEEFIAIVQKAIESIAYPQEPAELYNPIRYELSLGGKRIRPVLTLLACELFDGDYREALDAATGIEIFHKKLFYFFPKLVFRFIFHQFYFLILIKTHIRERLLLKIQIYQKLRRDQRSYRF